MKIEIKISKGNKKLGLSKGDKELYLNGDFVASWAGRIDVMKIIIPLALDHAFEMGRESKLREIREVMGIMK